MNTIEYETISLKEIFGILRKNIFFIIMFILAGVVGGLLISGVQMMRNPIEYNYTAKSTIELVNITGRRNQVQVAIHVLRSTGVLQAAKDDLGITGDYKVSVTSTTRPDQYDVIVQGEDENQVVNLVDQLVYRGHNLTTGAMFMTENRIVETGHVFESPIEVSSRNVNPISNVAVGVIFAGPISVLLIFFIRYMDGRVHSEKDVERILNTKVLVTQPNESKESKFKKFFKVR